MRGTRTCPRCHGTQEKRPTGEGVRWVHISRDMAQICRAEKKKDQLNLPLCSSVSSVVKQ
jgi:hypothetical protein